MINTSSSCIDLIFTSNPSLITEFGIEKFLYTDGCHHSILFGKMNFNVPLPPPYSSEGSVYNEAGRKNIQRSIKNCNWARLLINLTINERVELLSNIINISKKYMPKKKFKI